MSVLFWLFDEVFITRTQSQWRLTLQSWMHICSLSLSLGLICFTGSVQSQSCYEDRQCASSQCCKSGTCADIWPGTCPCRFDSQCRSNEKCSAGSCSLRIYRRSTTPVFNFPSQKPYTIFVPQCYWNSDCSNSEVCRGGRCEYNNESGGGFTWTGSRVLGIVLFVVIGTIVSCLYHLCKRARKPPVLAPRNGNVSAPPTGVAVTRIEHEARPETSSTNVTMVRVEDDSPLPPDGPPPYNSLQFESRQNRDEDLPEQPPPSYDEAVRNSGIAPV